MGSSPAARHAEGLGGADQRSDGLSHEESPTFQTLGSERLVYPPTSASNHDRPAESRGADHRRVSPSCSPPYDSGDLSPEHPLITAHRSVIRPAFDAIDHLVYATPDLQSTVADLERRLGVGATVGGRHPQWGTHNAILSLGSGTYLEILAPDPGRSATIVPTIFGIDALAAPRLVAWAAKAQNLEARVAAAARRGVLLGAISEASRQKPDGSVLSWRLTDPTVTLGDGLVPFLIDWADSPHPATSAPRAGGLLDLRAEHPDPDHVRSMLEAVGFLLSITPSPAPALMAQIETPAGAVELR